MLLRNGKRSSIKQKAQINLTKREATLDYESQYGSTRLVVDKKNKLNYDSDVHDSFLSLIKQRVKLNELVKPCVAKQGRKARAITNIVASVI